MSWTAADAPQKFGPVAPRSWDPDVPARQEPAPPLASDAPLGWPDVVLASVAGLAILVVIWWSFRYLYPFSGS
jgi:hypothetical protein